MPKKFVPGDTVVIDYDSAQKKFTFVKGAAQPSQQEKVEGVENSHSEEPQATPESGVTTNQQPATNGQTNGVAQPANGDAHNSIFDTPSAAPIQPPTTGAAQAVPTESSAAA